MAKAAEAKKWRRVLQDAGFTVELNQTGHWEVRTEEGEKVSTFPQTPSDPRWIANARADVRRWKRSQGMPVGRPLLSVSVPRSTQAFSHQDAPRAEEYINVRSNTRSSGRRHALSDRELPGSFTEQRGGRQPADLRPERHLRRPVGRRPHRRELRAVVTAIIIGVVAFIVLAVCSYFFIFGWD